MIDDIETFDTLDRQLADDLRGLGQVTAPPSLTPLVLVRTGLADGYWRLDTPIGAAFAAWSPDGVAALLLGDEASAFERDYGARFRRRIVAATPPATLAEMVARRMDGDRTPNLRFDLRGLTEFERAVLDKARQIPRGEVRPYGWIAKEIGRPAAARAVGSALGRNPIPLLIPCHRVLRGDGRVGGYVFGGAHKRALLDLEGARPDDLETDARAGVRLHGSDTTKIFCYPTCRCARRVTDRHRVTFGSASEAAAVGYRPCKVCRPVAA